LLPRYVTTNLTGLAAALSRDQRNWRDGVSGMPASRTTYLSAGGDANTTISGDFDQEGIITIAPGYNR
jgi:hypothetical protein